MPKNAKKTDMTLGAINALRDRHTRIAAWIGVYVYLRSPISLNPKGGGYTPGPPTPFQRDDAIAFVRNYHPCMIEDFYGAMEILNVRELIEVTGQRRRVARLTRSFSFWMWQTLNVTTVDGKTVWDNNVPTPEAVYSFILRSLDRSNQIERLGIRAFNKRS